MTTIRPIFGAARLRVSRISFRCDVTSAKGVEIPLGVIADMQAGGLYGLGLMVRMKLTDSESSMIGPLFREALRRPFDLLLRQFDEVLDSKDPSDDFASLYEKHCSSLCFSIPEETVIQVPRQLSHNAESESFPTWTKLKLEAGMADCYWDFVEAQEKQKVELRAA